MAFDPENPTFYGESYQLWRAKNVTGDAISDDGRSMQLLYGDDSRQQLVEGQSILAAVIPVEQYLTPGDEAVISWVVETDSDSSGSIAFRAGRDFDFDPAAATENLGTVSVSGRQTIVLKQSVFSAADVFVYPWPMPTLLVDALSGSVAIRQIRLRVWPPGGGLGSWQPEAGYNQRGPMLSLEAFGLITVPGTPEPRPQHTDAWKEMTGNLQDVAGPVIWGNFDDTLGRHTQMALDHEGDGELVPRTWFSWGVISPRRVTWQQYPARPGRFAHPDIVPADPAAWGISLDGGVILPTFDRWGGEVALITNGALEPWYGVSLPGGELHPDPEEPDRYHGDYVAPKRLADYHRGLPPALPDIMLTPVPGEFFSNPPPPAEYKIFEVQIDVRLEAIELVPDHLVFNPALAPDVDDEPTPRFFWKDEVGQWRAIGPGKPADDPVLLRIKTAMGLYREPRHGEDIEGHGAHPLKVKTSEGYGAGAWDTPVWMTPLD